MVRNQNGFMNHIRSELSFSVPNEQYAESNRRPRRGRRESGSAGRYPPAPSPADGTNRAARRENYTFFSLFLCRKEIIFYFCSVKTATAARRSNIGLWCNGNTTDSGPVIPSSNLGSPTKKVVRNARITFFSFLRPTASRPRVARAEFAC